VVLGSENVSLIVDQSNRSRNTMNTEAQTKQVYERWHDMIVSRNLDGLMELYAEDCVLESSAVLVLEKNSTGIVKGRDLVRKHFAAFFGDMMAKDAAVELYRPSTYFSDGKTLVWEYPSKSPKGNQLDVVESMDLENGLIAYHRVYWGWIGFKALQAVANRSK
jgi:steroid Delta-isomerase